MVTCADHTQNYYYSCIIAKVVPIYKSDDKLSISNYRTVSILPAISKILERLMYNRLYEYFESNSHLTDKQFVFKARSTTRQVWLRSVSLTKSVLS